MKNRPYAKTVVTEIKIQLADLLTRTVLLKASVAAPIPTTDAFNSGDVVVTTQQPLQIEKVNSCLIISSFEDFEVLLGEIGQVVLPCKGLFVHNGSAGAVGVRPAVGAESARIQYVYS